MYAQNVFAVSGSNLISFEATAPTLLLSNTVITGIDADLSISGMDFRPATGQLYALGYNQTSGNARIYTIDKTTGAATAVGAAPIALDPEMGKIGFDFNPTVDRIRVTGSNNANYRLHPVTGALVAVDGDLSFSGTDPNAGANPSVGTVAYTNSYIGATSTTLYNIDDSLGILTTQLPPNNGVLNTVGNLGINLHPDNQTSDFDIVFDAATASNVAFLVTSDEFTFLDYLFSVNLQTGASTLVGAVGAGLEVDDIAIEIIRDVPATVTGHLVFALSSTGNLISFDSDLPGVIRSVTPVSGVATGQVLAGMDFRPATGELYALGYNNMNGEARLYTIHTMTGVATAVGSAPVMLEAGMNKIGFDFNPTVDRIRVTGSNNANYRLHPVTGAVAATDLDLAFAATDLHAAANPSIGAVAYTNSYIGAATTVLYNYDDSLNVLTTQIPPNNGVLNTVGNSGIVLNLLEQSADLDIFFDTTTHTNQAFLSANIAGFSIDQWYRLDLASGNATLIGSIGLGIAVNDIAIQINRNVPEEITGHLVYALTGNNNLISFDSDAPAIVRSLVPVSGLAAGQVLSGMDFRPATGELYVLGYNSTTGEANLYTVNTTTGAATTVGAAPAMLEAGMGKIGFDFNPTVDRIRLTGSNNANYRLHPVTGAVVATDADLAFAATDVNAAANPSIGAVAYTNSYIGTTATVLYNYDDSLNVLTTQIPPNNGVLNTIGISGLSVNLTDASSDMDIFFDGTSSSNAAYLSANTGVQTIDQLFRLDLAIGLAIPKGFIGFGIPVTDIAVLIDRVVPDTLAGRLIYALTSTNNLISFDSEAPGIVRDIVPVTGVAVGQLLVGMDFRPSTGDLVALGYNAVTGEARLYNVDRISGVATAIGDAAVTLALGTGDIGVDFNPVVDRIRVVGANNANYRLHPGTGALVATDGNLSFAAADVNSGINPAVGAAAYSNSFNGTTATTLFVYDDSLNVFCTQNPPNNGVLNTIGASGFIVNPSEASIDFDIYYDFETAGNEAYVSANTGAALVDQFYTVDLASGSTSLAGKIGLGIAVRDIAVYIDSIGVVAVGDPIAQQTALNAQPNPASQQTNIVFTLQESASVRLEVTDMTGRHVATLLDGQMPAGIQQARWDVAQQPAGMYLLRLISDQYLLGTTKIVVQGNR
ncbi:MAG: DUF4394 domain-containing protein [Saprospiraceae bacterium]|nr:DUF4394 domain-containing protein [Saprospiraceae bacterium]